MLAFDTAWSFLKSDVLEKDYAAAQRAARREGLPDATTSAIYHPYADLEGQMAPRYSPDMDEEEEEMEDKEAKKERLVRLLEQMRGNRAAM
tara:strand:- start:106 stop:378 length:273 start_codon:yes stop_codon:yes gene_type:complete